MNRNEIIVGLCNRIISRRCNRNLDTNVVVASKDSPVDCYILLFGDENGFDAMLATEKWFQDESLSFNETDEAHVLEKIVRLTS